MQGRDNPAIAETVERERTRLRTFVRSRVRDLEDVEDILQDVFCEFVIASQMATPIANATGWLLRVARNRIIDLFRRQKQVAAPVAGDDDELRLEDLLPARSAGPDAEYFRAQLYAEFESALAELPAEQRHVFLAHEFEGRSFRELSAETGIGVNTLLARKRYAVLHLRRRLQPFLDKDF